MPDEALEIDYDAIDITDDYMFSTVMQDPELCIALLELLIPGRKIERIRYIHFDDDGLEIDESGARVETQKTLSGYYGFRGVRLDVYLDDGRSVYNVEMQTTTDRALAQRSRFYQSHIDMSMLRRGRPYDKLGECYVIFICKFDPFGRGLSRYSFRYRCDGRHSLTLNDGAYRLFFNTTGTILNIPPKLRELLKYMNDTRAYDVAKSDSELIHRIDRAVTATKHSQKWRQDYMIYQVKEREAELRGEEIGEKRGEKIGEERGRKAGRAEGLVEGEVKGRTEEKNEIMLSLFEEGLPDDLIAKVTRLSLSEVQALRSKLQK